MLHDEFVEENGQTYYLGSDGVRVSGLQDIKGQTYYFNPDRNGQLSYGLNVVGDKLYLFGDAGKENAGQLVKDTHLNNGDFKLNIDPNGIVTVANNHPAFLQDNGGHWYYMDKDGKLMTGPQTIDGLTYYFDSMVDRSRGNAVRSMVNPIFTTQITAPLWRTASSPSKLDDSFLKKTMLKK